MLCLVPLPLWKPVLQQTKIIPQVILASDFATFFVKQNAQSQVTSAVLRGKQRMALKSGWAAVAALRISLLWEEKPKLLWPQKWRFGLKNVQLHVSCPWAVVQGRMAAVLQEAGESTKHQELSSSAFPTCLASTWGGVNKDLLKEYKKGPPGAITLNLPFQVLSINTVPQSNPAGTL